MDPNDRRDAEDRLRTALRDDPRLAAALALRDRLLAMRTLARSAEGRPSDSGPVGSPPERLPAGA
ncbi:MAG: hypothetical protein ACF8XB_09400 [Planctomycetota bacterium JB042]